VLLAWAAAMPKKNQWSGQWNQHSDWDHNDWNQEPSESFFEKEERLYGAAGNLASTTGQAGGTASAKVRQAEWSGQLAWNNANHPSKPKAEHDWSAEGQLAYLGFTDNVPDWIQIKRDAANGDTLTCTLCSTIVTAEHLTSKKHMKQISYLCVPAPAATAPGAVAATAPSGYPSPAAPRAEMTIEQAFKEWGIPIIMPPIPSYYILKDDGWGGKSPYCTLCRQCCTAEHITGKNHKKKLQWEQPGSW